MFERSRDRGSKVKNVLCKFFVKWTPRWSKAGLCSSRFQLGMPVLAIFAGILAILLTVRSSEAQTTPDPKSKDSTPSSTSSIKNGERLFTKYGCYECHGSQGQGSTQTGGSRIGPPQIPVSAVVSYLRHPTGQMPPYTTKTVSDEEIADIYAFLKSLPQPTPSKDIPSLNQ